MRAPACLLAVLAVALAAQAAHAHGVSQGTFDDIQHAIFTPSCALYGCHIALSAGSAGGLSLEDDGQRTSWGALVGFGFGQQPNNSAAANNLKMRVDPGRPWNSFIIDKLRGHLKANEGARMPYNAAPLSECAIREIERWIVAGAPELGFVPGDEYHSGQNGCNPDPSQATNLTCVIDPCTTAQAPLAAPTPPADGVRLHLLSAPLSAHDAALEQVLPATVSAGSITAIEVFARSGTDHLTITRTGDDAPIMVLEGDPASDDVQSETLALPAGTGIPIAAGQSFTLRQALVADRFDPPPVAEAYVNLHLSSDPTLRPLEPFMDSLGTGVLLAPPRSYGGTGGFWQAPAGGTTVFALRLWTDRRAARAIAAGPGGVAFTANGQGPYQVFAGGLGLPPASGLAYGCEHDNTHLVHALRWGCAATGPVGALPPPPPGEPAIAGASGPAPWCADQLRDCSEGSTCVPANLVGGDGVEDGRCTLLGLQAAPP